jgi:hypothetical protein
MATPTTMIGSMPHLKAGDALAMLEQYPLSIPAWPQLPRRSFREAMTVQYSEGFPGIIIDEAEKTIRIGRGDQLLDDMAKFYELILAEDPNAFAISAAYAQGCGEFIKRLEKRGSRLPFVKGQVTGPFTLGLSLSDTDGKSAWFDEQYKDIVLKGLGAKAVWQVRRLSPYADQVAIFFDEPIFSALGTPAYMGIQDEEVIGCINELSDQVHAAGALSGVHCCGNMDWSLLALSALDIIAFDAYSFGDKITLYPEAIGAFLNRGGKLAWGIVPTGSAESIAEETVDSLISRMRDIEAAFEKKGIARALVAQQRMLTPSCGMGNLEIAQAQRVLMLLQQLSSAL